MDPHKIPQCLQRYAKYDVILRLKDQSSLERRHMTRLEYYRTLKAVTAVAKESGGVGQIVEVKEESPRRTWFGRTRHRPFDKYGESHVHEMIFPLSSFETEEEIKNKMHEIIPFPEGYRICANYSPTGKWFADAIDINRKKKYWSITQQWSLDV